MKANVPASRRSLALFAFVSLLAAAQPLLAATPKTDARAAALVAALQAVSPDPLGGRLGSASVTVTPAIATPPATSRSVASRELRTDGDRRAYLAWKSAQKS